MRLSLAEKINMIITQQKSMLAFGEKYSPLIKSRVQRIAVRLMIGFFALVFICTIISRASHAFVTANVSVSNMTSGTLTNRAEVEGTIQAAASKSITLPEGLKVVAVNIEKGSQINEGDPLMQFDVSSVEEQIEKLEEEICILNLRIDLLSNSNSNDVIMAQRSLEDAKKAYEQIAAEYNRTDMRLKEDYTKLEETLGDAQKNLLEKAEALVRDAEENLKNVESDAEDAIRAAEHELGEASENLDVLKRIYQDALEAFRQAEDNLNMAKQKVSDIEQMISEQGPDDSTDYTEALKGAKEELSAAQEAFNQAKKELSKADYTSSSYDRANENLDSIKKRWKEKIEKARGALYDAEMVLESVREGKDFSGEASVMEAQAAIDAARDALNQAQRESEDNRYSEEEDLYSAGRAVETAQIELENAQRQAAAVQKENEIVRITYESERAEKEALRNALQEILDHGGQLLSPTAGTVLMTLERGDRTRKDEDVVTFSSEDKGFVFEGVLDGEYAQLFFAGETGELHYKSAGNTQKAEVEIHSVSPPDAENKVYITAILPEGNYPVGVSAQLSLSKKSENYDSCLPITALRSDSGGDYVFVLRKQTSVMGTEWVTSRIDIIVKDRDSQMMSIESALTYSDKVITGSNKTISEGDRVRIEN